MSGEAFLLLIMCDYLPSFSSAQLELPLMIGLPAHPLVHLEGSEQTGVLEEKKISKNSLEFQKIFCANDPPLLCGRHGIKCILFRFFAEHSSMLTYVEDT